MTTYGAYNAGLPCKNPSCKSHGQPHPNCRCYGDMADGGEVTHYCARGEPHQKGCQYYAEGTGDVTAVDEVPADDMPAGTSGEVPAEDMPVDQEKYGTATQQIGAGIEGLAQGIAGPVATLAEKGLSKLGVPGLSDEDIRGRAEANPVTHGVAEATGLIGSMVSGVGEAALAAKAAAHIAEFAGMGKVGSTLLKGAVASGLIQGGDEVSNHLLNDPEASVSGSLINTGAAGLFGIGGAVAGEAAGSIGKNLVKGVPDLGEWHKGLLSGLGVAAEQNPEKMAIFDKMPKGESTAKGYSAGKSMWDTIAHSLGAGGLGGAFGAERGYEHNGITGAITGGLEGAALAAASTTALNFIGNKAVAPFVTKALANSGTVAHLGEYAEHMSQAIRGATRLHQAVDALFKVGPQQLYNAPANDRNREALKDYISEGGIDQNVQQQIYQENATQPVPHFAEGGEVKPRKQATQAAITPVLEQNQGIQIHAPEQNVMLSTTKGRVSNYLKSIQPQTNAPKLAFDSAPKDKQAERNYDKAIDIALNPLSVLQHVKNGTIEPEQIKHLNSMYPEVMSQMSQSLTNRISKAQLKNEKPAYQTRLGMSMMLGTPLDSSMTPQSIQAIQSGFASQQSAQQGQQGGGKGSKKALDKAPGQYRTADESRILNKAKG